MRIGIDATGILAPVRTGIQRYATSLVVHLAEAISHHEQTTLYLYAHTGNPGADPTLLRAGSLGRSGRVVVRQWPFRRGYRVALGGMAARDRVDVLHVPEPSLPRWAPCPLLVTVHDVCWSRLAPDVVAGERMTAAPVVAEAVRKGHRFIAVSETTRDDLVAGYGVTPQRIWVTPEGVDAQYRPVPDGVAAVRRKYGLDRFILYVGTLQHRKNLVRLLEGYAQLASAGELPQRLVLAGSNGWGHLDVQAAVARLGLHERVTLLGYVPEADLPALYTAADLFVYPSLYEGFGLPVLEAMACGTPVAVSRVSALPEVAGDAACYFDPYDPKSIAREIGHVLRAPRLLARLRELGLQRSQQFTWQHTANTTLAAYRAAAGGW